MLLLFFLFEQKIRKIKQIVSQLESLRQSKKKLQTNVCDTNLKSSWPVDGSLTQNPDSQPSNVSINITISRIKIVIS